MGIINSVYIFYHKGLRGKELEEKCNKSIRHIEYLRGSKPEPKDFNERQKYQREYYQRVSKKRRQEKSNKFRAIYEQHK